MHPLAIHADLAIIRAVGSRQYPNQSALAGPVVPDQSNDLAPANTEVSALQRPDMTKMPDYATGVD
jgi:hypothetical protein